MLFHEIYGSYFQVVAAVLTEAAEGPLTGQRLTELVREKAFAESALVIPRALRTGAWPLLDGDGRTVLRHRPSMPLTALQKRWMKALLADPRIALFAPDPSGLEEVSPLYPPGTFLYFDQYTDGDPYEDPVYISCFRTALQAIREHRKLRIRFRSRTGARHAFACLPHRLEYSPKDDKFRLAASGGRGWNLINMARISSCELLEEYDPQTADRPEGREKELTLLLSDERNALERVLLHFSHFEKEARKLGGGRYQIRLRYDEDDETELLIRILSFGPVLQVTAPHRMIQLVRDRIRNQLDRWPAPAGGGPRPG